MPNAVAAARPVAHYSGAAAYAALALATLWGAGGGVGALLTAALELAGAVALLDSDVAPAASVALSLTTGGAVAAALVAHAPVVPALTLLAASLAVLWATRGDRAIAADER